MSDWLNKEDLQRSANGLPDDAVLCPHCCSRMELMEGDNGLVYQCRNEMCLYEDEIPQQTVLNV